MQPIVQVLEVTGAIIRQALAARTPALPGVSIVGQPLKPAPTSNLRLGSDYAFTGEIADGVNPDRLSRSGVPMTWKDMRRMEEVFRGRGRIGNYIQWEHN